MQTRKKASPRGGYRYLRKSFRAEIEIFISDKLFEKKRRLPSFDDRNGHLIRKMLFHSIRTTSKNLLCFDNNNIRRVLLRVASSESTTTSGLKGRLFDGNWQRRGGRPRNAETRGKRVLSRARGGLLNFMRFFIDAS